MTADTITTRRTPEQARAWLRERYGSSPANPNHDNGGRRDRPPPPTKPRASADAAQPETRIAHAAAAPTRADAASEPGRAVADAPVRVRKPLPLSWEKWCAERGITLPLTPKQRTSEQIEAR